MIEHYFIKPPWRGMPFLSLKADPASFDGVMCSCSYSTCVDATLIDAS
jgi:hypothetical protein